MKQYTLVLDPDEMWLVVEALLCLSSPVGSAELIKKHPQIDIVGAAKGLSDVTDKLINCLKSLPFEEAVSEAHGMKEDEA